MHHVYLYEAGLALGVQRLQQGFGVPNLQQRLRQQVVVTRQKAVCRAWYIRCASAPSRG